MCHFFNGITPFFVIFFITKQIEVICLSDCFFCLDFFLFSAYNYTIEMLINQWIS